MPAPVRRAPRGLLLAAALAKAGYPRRARPTDAAASPEGAAKLLESMTLTSQFGAVREFHAAGGDESARLGGLVRGYAHLGQLTAHHWSAAHKAFKARALLYAERMVARAPASAAAHWHRAYARALAGFPAAALAALAEADKLRAAGKKADPPAWVEDADAFARRDFVRLAAAARPGRPDAELATLLAYLVAEEEGRNIAFSHYARRASQALPECYRVYDGICQTGQLNLIHAACDNGPEKLRETLPARVAEL